MGAATKRRGASASAGTKVREPKLGPNEVGQGEDGVWWIPLHLIIPFADQPRKEFDEADLQSLARGIGEVGQKNPGQLRQLQFGTDPRYELVDGERRWQACKLAGKTHFRAILVTVTREEQYVDSVTLNFGRASHSAGEVLGIILKLKAMNKTNAQIASILGSSEGFVNQYFELSRLHPEILVLLGPPTPASERIPVTIGRTLTQLEGRDQLSAWKELSRGEISMRRAQAIVRQALESGAQRNASIRARTRKPSDVVRLVEGRLSSVLDLLSTLAEDPMLGVILEAEWSKHREEALEQIEDIIADAEDLRDKLLGEEAVGRKDKKRPKGGKASKAEPATPDKTHERDRGRKRLLKALAAMSETTYDLWNAPDLATMFVGQPYSMVSFARMSVTELIRQLQKLDQKLPDVEDRHRYDQHAKLVGEEKEPVPTAPTPENESDYEVDETAAPPFKTKKKATR